MTILILISPCISLSKNPFAFFRCDDLGFTSIYLFIYLFFILGCKLQESGLLDLWITSTGPSLTHGKHLINIEVLNK